MFVAAARIEIHIPASQSLKDRRRVLKPLIERTRNRFNAAVADVGPQDKWQVASIGLSVVGSSIGNARERLDEVVRFIEEFSPEAITTSVDTDVLPFGD
jgi:hypothetical protein